MSRSYDPVRLAAPDGLVAEVDGVTGRRYKATGGGMYEMHPRDAKIFKAEGAFVPSVGGVTRGGYTCPGCGFRAVVRTCSRCGQHCETAAERRAREFVAAFNAGMPYGPSRVVEAVVPCCDEDPANHLHIEYRRDPATGELHEIGPVRREAPIAVRPQDLIPAAREIVFGPAHSALHIDPRYVAAAVRRDSMMRSYGSGA